MARIPDEQLEHLKRDISLVKLVEATGVQLNKKGQDLVGCCPFHDDDTPSLVVSPSKNLWHCLGACQQGGSVIDWVMKSRGVSFRHAVELLKEDRPLLAAEPPSRRGRQEGPVPKASIARPLAEGAFDGEADDAALLGQVVDYYHQSLLDDREALGYLRRRGLEDDAMIAHFKLGFAGRTLGYRLPPRTRAAGRALRERLTRLGVYRQSGHEHLAGSVVVPIFDAEGRVTELYGRKIHQNLRAGTPSHLYLPGPHRGVFNLAGIAEADGELILCEALFDALAFWRAGMQQVTASYGTAGFTKDHRRALSEHGIERVYIAYDRDKAGEAAADKLAVELAGMGIEAFRVLFPKGMDACAYAKAVSPASRSLPLAVSQAQWMRAGRATAAVPAAASSSKHPCPPLGPPPGAPAASPPSSREAAGAPGGGLEQEQQAAEEREAASAPSESASPSAPPPSRPAPKSAPRAVTPDVPLSSAAAAPAAGAPVLDEQSGEVRFVFGDRRWRARGLGRKPQPDSLRINLFVERAGSFHVDTLELYAAKQRAAFVAVAADELGLEPRIVKQDLGRVLLGLEQLRDAQRGAAAEAGAPELSDDEREQALSLLRNPHLVDRLLEDFDRAGVVGERTNQLLGYLAVVSRKLASPLAVVIQSSSAAGKSSLMEAILSFVPDEDRIQYSAMTGQSLFYMGEQDLRHRILAIVEEEGAERASYALKLLQSEGELTIASTGKNPTTGRLVTQEYRVEGPVMIMLTTTAIDVDEELLNRCIVLTVDESQAQTRAIHAAQRRAETLEGLLERRERVHLRKLHQNAQRLLRPLLVVNPHAERLRFFDHKTRTRRDHTKYLTLIRAIALLHQHQRPIKTTSHRGERIAYIEVTESDIALAERLCRRILARGIDELPPQTRRLLGDLERLVAERACEQGLDATEVVFSRRQVRQACGWSHAQLKVHLRRLAELEYVALVAGGPRRQHLYTLAAPPEPDDLDADDTYDGHWSGSEGTGRGLVGVGARPDPAKHRAGLPHLVAVDGSHGEGDDVAGERSGEAATG